MKDKIQSDSLREALVNYSDLGSKNTGNNWEPAIKRLFKKEAVKARRQLGKVLTKEYESEKASN